MNLKINLNHFTGKKVLVAPLDWGLGHATRCIPIIQTLVSLGCEVWLAGEGNQEILLKNEFPQLPFLQLKGYRVNYAVSGMAIKILGQIPRILKVIKEEKKWLDEQVLKYAFDVVISDNRYGLYHEKVHAVFITHQLCVKSPFGKWTESILRQWNYKFINRFNECWVPDEKGENNLAGELSHPAKLPVIPVNYIGFLSRFADKDFDVDKKFTKEIKNHLLIILSGPEPQRSLFENIIVEQIAHYRGTATIVRGLPAATDIIPSSISIRFYNHLSADELKKEMDIAEYIISRSGYSTVMDIAAMKKKSILVATPGQTEQEYLSGYLGKIKFAYCTNQKKYSLQHSLEEATLFPYIFIS